MSHTQDKRYQKEPTLGRTGVKQSWEYPGHITAPSMPETAVAVLSRRRDKVQGVQGFITTGPGPDSGSFLGIGDSHPSAANLRSQKGR